MSMAEQSTQQPVTLPDLNIKGRLDAFRQWIEVHVFDPGTMIGVARLRITSEPMTGYLSGSVRERTSTSLK
jgi:hypothetical protein